MSNTHIDSSGRQGWQGDQAARLWCALGIL